MKFLKFYLIVLILSLFIFPTLTNAQGGDLSVSQNDIRFSDDIIVSGDSLKIYVTVHNNSNYDLIGIVKFYDEFSKKDIGNDTPFAIVSNQIQTLFTSTILETYGYHNIAVRIIPTISSGDDSKNNKAYKKIFVDGDLDKDGISDSIDKDKDGDGIFNNKDKFPDNPKEFEDTDNDGIGDNEDEDDDNDEVEDIKDDLPKDHNETIDTDNDGIGNNSDNDIDNDGISNNEEILTDPLKFDTDGDGLNDKEDFWPLDAQRSIDTDKDGKPNFDDNDDDNDGHDDNEDKFPLNPKEWQDSDGDSIGNNEDPDDDNDGWTDKYELEVSLTNPIFADSDKDGQLDSKDRFPLDPKEWQDNDNDKIGDNKDTDDDNDGYYDNEDKFPLNPKELEDSDKDGIGDNEDPDDDNDLHYDSEDAFPLNYKEWQDLDNDGIGNNEDSNDNNKGPIINITKPEKIISGIPVIFSALSSSDEDGVVISAKWHSSDNQESNDFIFEPCFSHPGKYQITLSITDDKQESRTKIFDVYVEYNIKKIVFYASVIGIFIIFIISVLKMKIRKKNKTKKRR